MDEKPKKPRKRADKKRNSQELVPVQPEVPAKKKVKDILMGKIVDGPGLDPNLQAEIALALKKFAATEAYSNHVLNRDMGVLEAVISEYLKTFVIIGYDINGDKISITHATSAQEYDSIVEHARGTLMQMLIRSQQGNFPGMPPGM